MDKMHSDFKTYFDTIVPIGLDFDPVRDVAPVDQVGFVDLSKAFQFGVVPGNLEVDFESYNGVEDPASLVGRSSDVFDAIRKANAVKAAEAAMAAEASPSGANGD